MKKKEEKKEMKTPSQNCLLNILSPMITNRKLGGGIKNKAFTLLELLGVTVILGAILLVTVPSMTKTLKNKKEEEYQRFLSDIYLAAEAYIGLRNKEYPELIYCDRAVVELKELIDAGYISANRINPKTKEEINPLETIMVTKQMDGTYSYVLSGKENGKSSYIKDGLLLWLDGKEYGNNEYVWNDLSGNGSHGILGGFEDNQQFLWHNNSLTFDGQNDYVMTGVINTDCITFSMVVKVLYNASNQTLHLGGNWENAGYGLYVSTQQFLSFQIYNNGVWKTGIRADKKIKWEKIYHITGRYDGEVITFFVDGQKQIIQKDAPGMIEPSVSSFMIGQNPDKNSLPQYPLASYFPLEVYSVKIYNRALRDEEIYKDYEIEKMRFGI